eukprot:7048841-Pyramimonas_sp.AAC.1
MKTDTPCSFNPAFHRIARLSEAPFWSHPANRHCLGSLRPLVWLSCIRMIGPLICSSSGRL